MTVTVVQGIITPNARRVTGFVTVVMMVTLLFLFQKGWGWPFTDDMRLARDGPRLGVTVITIIIITIPCA